MHMKIPANRIIGVLMALALLAVCALPACAPSRTSGSLPRSWSGAPEDPGVTIRLVRDCVDCRAPVVVTVNGFLSEGDSLDDWRAALAERYGKCAWVHVDWEAASIASATAYLLTAGLAIAAIARTKKVSEFTADDWRRIAALVDANSWRRALRNAQTAGRALCRYLMAHRRDAPGDRYVLMGNSLGAGVVFVSLACLADAGIDDAVDSAHLLGGAVTNDTEAWRHALRAVTGAVWNYYSPNDEVLAYLYPVATLFANAPAGRSPITGVRGVENIDVSARVSGHLNYKNNAAAFLR